MTREARLAAEIERPEQPPRAVAEAGAVPQLRRLHRGCRPRATRPREGWGSLVRRHLHCPNAPHPSPAKSHLSGGRRSRASVAQLTRAATYNPPVALEYSPFTRRTDTKVRRYIEARDILRQGERIVVGISGGPDSTALLVLLSRIAGKLGLQLTAGHFDHQLRGKKEAEADRAFVEGLCSELGIESDVRQWRREGPRPSEEGVAGGSGPKRALFVPRRHGQDRGRFRSCRRAHAG